MDILIISHFGNDFSNSDNDRFLYLANLLAMEGHKVELVTSDFEHDKKRHRKGAKADWSFQITFIHETGYPKNICLKRFYSHYVFGQNLIAYLKKRLKPDVVYCAVPSLTGSELVAKYCNSNGIRFIIDVQDLWPEAFRMAFDVPVISEMAFRPILQKANSIYKRADAVAAVSQSYVDRVLQVNEKCSSGMAVFLGTDLDTFDRNAAATFAKTLPKIAGEFWLGYAGTLGTSYDIPCVIDALAALQNPRLRLVIMGDGPMMADFEKYAKEKGAEVSFLGRLPYDIMCATLKKCDAVVNPIVGKSVASVINKHADYAAAGKAVLNTQNSREYIGLIQKYEMGFTVTPGDSVALARRLNMLVKDAALCRKMGENARRCAEECFDRKTTYQGLVNLITEAEKK